MVSWFAALFYMPRLLIYYVESKSLAEEAKEVLQKQYAIMQRRLWFIIGWPAMLLTIIFGVWMLVLRPVFLEQSWMLVKLAFVVCLLFYHFFTHMFYKKQSNSILALSSFQLRMWNEVATVLLIAIIFTVVFKDGMSWIYGVIGIVGVAVTLAFSVKRYKAWREKSGEK
jgi:putative membrane protein